jgi:putative membrane protein
MIVVPSTARRSRPAESPIMNALGQAAALTAALIHVYIFVLEAVLFPRPVGYRTFGVAGSDVPAVRPWAFNQGFYNLFLAIVTAAGLVLLHTGTAQGGRALVAAGCGSMIAAAAVLLATNRRMIRAAAVQGLAPLVAIVLLIVA